MSDNSFDDLRNIFDTFLEMGGQKFDVERNDVIIATYDVLTNTSSSGEKYIGFHPTCDIQCGDWLINSVGERFYVRDKKTDYVAREPNQLKIYYDTEAQYKINKNQTSSTVYNIGTANSSVFGNHNNFSISYNESLSNLKNEVQNSDSTDKEELQEIVQLLEMIVNNKVPASKGIFSKFSEIMERNSWITGSVMSTILSWLTSHI